MTTAADVERVQRELEASKKLNVDLEKILLREGNAEASQLRLLAAVIAERDEHKAKRAEYASEARSLRARLADEQSEVRRTYNEMRDVLRERDEARAEVERLERLFHQTHGCHYSWVEARHKTAERQREACAKEAADFYANGMGDPQYAVRFTPLVTEGDE